MIPRGDEKGAPVRGVRSARGILYERAEGEDLMRLIAKNPLLLFHPGGKKKKYAAFRPLKKSIIR